MFAMLCLLVKKKNRTIYRKLGTKKYNYANLFRHASWFEDHFEG